MEMLAFRHLFHLLQVHHPLGSLVMLVSRIRWTNSRHPQEIYLIWHTFNLRATTTAATLTTISALVITTVAMGNSKLLHRLLVEICIKCHQTIEMVRLITDKVVVHHHPRAHLLGEFLVDMTCHQEFH
jgi:hypothetical protein